MTGFRTNKRYNYATIYVDQATKLDFMHLQKTQTAEETVQDKDAFEAYTQHNGVAIQAYHGDNEILKANLWVAN